MFQIATLEFADSTTLIFVPVGGSATFDVVRGRIGGLSFGVGSVDLGEVVCLAEDQSTMTLTDTDVPFLGEAFFYTARFRSVLCALEGYPYGYAECLERKVSPGNGDCVP